MHDEPSGKLRRIERDVDRRMREIAESDEIKRLPGAGAPLRDTSHTGETWAAKHVRNPRPTRVVWQPSRAWKTAFYWLSWERPAMGGRARPADRRGIGGTSLST